MTFEGLSSITEQSESTTTLGPMFKGGTSGLYNINSDSKETVI